MEVLNTNNFKHMYDIIGDIHGHADKLEILLLKLGYKRVNGVYKHPQNRKVAFLGDFIDRGPQIRETLHLTKDMCDAGNAIAIMGNHEYNAICFHTPHTEKGGFFRDHSLTEIEQHLETLRQFKFFQDEWQYFLEWFKTLPLYFENDDFRMVHACWDQKHIDWIENNPPVINDQFLSAAADKNHPTYAIIEETLKGKESDLPNGQSFTDKDGHVRTKSRVMWWTPLNERTTYNDVFMGCPDALTKTPIPTNENYYSYTDTKPVFFGHYWFSGSPEITNPNAICLDYSVAKGGKLVACRLEKKAGKLLMELVV